MNEPTYGQADKVLRSLGFVCRKATLRTEALVYEHRETGAVIILPVASTRKKMLPPHLAAVQGTLKECGIVDPLDLAAKLQMAS